jgi:acyl-CoA thioesterase-1
MLWILRCLLSGHSYFIGLGLILLGSAAAGWPRTRRRAPALVWTGMALALLSASPAPRGGHSTLVVAAIAWQLGRALAATRKPLRNASALFLPLAALALATVELPWQRTPRLALAPGETLVVLGDSLSAGLGATDDGTWPRLLAERLGRRVVNLSRAGATLSSARAQAQLVPSGPTVVIVELGGNGLLAQVGAERFATDLRALLELVCAPERRVLMFELPLLPFQTEYGRAQRALSREKQVALIPRYVLAGALTGPARTRDDLHLSPRGHEWLATRVEGILLGCGSPVHVLP